MVIRPDILGLVDQLHFKCAVVLIPMMQLVDGAASGERTNIPISSGWPNFCQIRTSKDCVELPSNCYRINRMRI